MNKRLKERLSVYINRGTGLVPTSYQFGKQLGHTLKRPALWSGIGSTLTLASSDLYASALTDAAQAGLDAAKTDGTTVGGYVVGVAAALVVVFVILGMVRSV